MAGMAGGTARFGWVGLAGMIGLAGYAAGLPVILSLWQRFFAWARGWLDLPVLLGEQTLLLPGGATLRVPELSATTPQPGPGTLVVAGAVTACVLGATFLLPRRLTPVKSFLRLLVVAQASAILFFATSIDPFPFRVADYLFGLLSTGMIAMALVPPVLALTLYPVDLTWPRKLGITLFLMAHFAVLTPLLTLVHAWLVLQGTAVIMPALFVGFGLLPYPLTFLAFYGWAMSWPGEFERREARAPVHSV
jgi:hypothetical protein